MMVPLSNSTLYGLRAAVLLASKNSSDFVTIRELSDELDISFYFLTKVLQHLTKSEILVSYKGPNGGVKLARPGNRITFMEIVESIDGSKIFDDCALGFTNCGILNPCPLQKDWIKLKKNIIEYMNTTTLEDLANKDQVGLLQNSKTGF